MDMSPEVNIDSVRSGGTLTSHDRDVVGDVNQRTQGTEFYGTSSNYVLLNQLFSHARQHSLSRYTTTPGRSNQSATNPDQRDPPPAGRMSLVNLLANEDDLLPPSREKSPHQTTSPSAFRSSAFRTLQQSNDRASSSISAASKLLVAERRLEKALVRSYMHNLHYLHPMIDCDTFIGRYEEYLAQSYNLHERSPQLRHFFALYNVVVSVGALVAGSDLTEEFHHEIKLMLQNRKDTQDPGKAPLQGLSRHYFRKSRSLLGDVFEACSLESAQTLFLMSLYCQNSLKPHACYMYCGMAVRTALAIGLPSESMSNSVEACKAARRTWWCIYSHEIDMCCSAGRFDSLGKPRKYPILQPQIKASQVRWHKENLLTSKKVFGSRSELRPCLSGGIQHRYDQRDGVTTSQKSTAAFFIDALLDQWKLGLPAWHNFDVVDFREPEWAAKQKLVLQLRYLNARVILHRPFLSDSTMGPLQERQKHIDLCLEAARKTIQILYESYANKHYFRTWWYNSTYTLYAGMIVLYVVMLGHSTVAHDVLLDDVKKSRDILRSMEEASVARRSADLLSEVLEVATAYTQQNQDARVSMPATLPASDASDGLARHGPSLLPNEISSTSFVQDPEAFMASLIDPNVLQDFTMDSNDWTGFGFSPSLEDFQGPSDARNNIFAVNNMDTSASDIDSNKVLFGSKSVTKLPDQIRRLDSSSPLILTSKGKNGTLHGEMLAKILTDASMIPAAVLNVAVMHTPKPVTEEALAQLKARAANCIVSIGGGSVVGLGKALSIRTGLKHICIPTTYSGSELTPILGETENGRKVTRSDPKILPDFVIYDVDLTMSLPVSTCSYSGVNAIAHAVESLYAVNTTPSISKLALDGIKELAEALPAIVQHPNDRAAREKAQHGAWLCGVCLGNSAMALHHKLCHTLGGSFNLPHAETHTIILPHAVAYNAPAIPETMEKLASVLPGSEDDAIRGLNVLLEKLKVSRALKEFGMQEEDIDKATDLAMSMQYANPRAMEKDAIRELIRRAWAGEPARV
ncbi:hypothetical protein E4T48_06004 [Aureobasidium sp. EXF-10727]|nr:hypothetical protein E4T48_06004 [Aureobasidium sp. EXF-10727]